MSRPAVSVDRRRGRFWIVIVLQHQTVAADADLAGPTERDDFVGIDRTDRHGGLRSIIALHDIYSNDSGA